MRFTTASTMLFCLAASSLPISGHASCYTVYDRDSRIALRSVRPPVDLSKTLSETVPKLVANGHMVMVPDETGCSEVEYRATVDSSSIRIEQSGGNQAPPQNAITARVLNPNPADLIGANKVQVSDYYREDGTRVQTYTRPAPSRGKF